MPKYVSDRMPPVSPELAEWLAKYYPPKCKEPGSCLESHANYGGKVELSQALIRRSSSDKGDDDKILERDV